jgi:MFS family permease
MGFSFAQSSDFVSAVICMFFTGVGWGCFSAMQATLIMFCTPLVARGRMMGLLTASIGLNTVGILHIGLLANWLGTELAILVSTAEGFLLLIFVCRLWPEIIAPQLLPSD